MKGGINKKIQQIIKSTKIKVDSFKIINEGGESLIIEVNDKWIFRFPRNSFFCRKMNKRLQFLISFSKVSPLKLPAPKYLGNDFMGYKKIPGKHLSPTTIEKLSAKDKLKIGKQLGLFLKTLHNFKSKEINFNTGYLIMRKKDYQSCPKEITKYLNKEEIKNFQAKLEVIANNPLNFVKPTKIIHGDFYYKNILWDPDKKRLTGVIDWAEAGLGIPAMDFIMLADFSKPKNDEFLKIMLASYGAEGEKLFKQIKEDYIINVMNWFWTYYKEKNTKGQARMIRKLRNMLH